MNCDESGFYRDMPIKKGIRQKLTGWQQEYETPWFKF